MTFNRVRSFFYSHPIWIFFLVALIAYLPILLPFFSLKNDLINQNLPTRFVFSEALRSGHEPFWNPFLNFGTPQYGDMNNGFWNPFQWTIGYLFGYSIYTITLEEFIYIVLGGWGFYKLSKEFVRKEIAILTGIAYLLCGYIVGHLQYLCWITGTAFFPFVLLYFLRTHRTGSLSQLAKFTLAIFLFLASSHPGLVIGALYFFLFLLVFLYSTRKDLSRSFYKDGFWKINLLMVICSILAGWVILASNAEVLAYISRGTKLSLSDTMLHPTTLSSYVSLVFPLTVNRWDLVNSDIGMRNSFIGLIHLMGAFYFFIYSDRKRWIQVLPGLLFFLLLASGGWFKYLAWKVLPLLGYVRLNGEFRYFALLILLGIGAAGVDMLLSEKNKAPELLKKFRFILLTTAIIAITLSGSWLLFKNTPLSLFNQSFGIKARLKEILDHTSWAHLLFFQAVLLLFVLLVSWRQGWRNTIASVMAYSLISTVMALPFTGIGITSKKEIQAVIDKFPKGIHLPPLASINEASYIEPEVPSVYLLIASFSKKIGYKTADQYPVVLRNQSAFIDDRAMYTFIKKQSYLFLSSDTTIQAQTNFSPESIRVNKFAPGEFSCHVQNKGYRWLTLLQNNYPLWEVSIDGRKVNKLTGFSTFISIPITQGEHEVVFSFNSRPIKRNLTISLVFILLSVIAVTFPAIGKRNLFNGLSTK